MDRRLPPPIASILLAVAVLGLSACGARVGPPEPAATGPAWERLADLPLTRRTGPVVAWTGQEVIAVGGEIGSTCPPMADCQEPNDSAKDGAALDPGTGR